MRFPKIKPNSPLILSFTFISLGVLILSYLIDGPLTSSSTSIGKVRWLFSTGGTGWSDVMTYFRMFSHILGHQDFAHYFGNFMLILLLGPILEEKYGWKLLLFMILVTAAGTSVLQQLFMNHYLLGASGIAFMLIILSSLSNFKTGEIPLTFILVSVIYLGKEIFESMYSTGNISHSAHIIGGVFGAIFGFLEGRKDA